MYSSINFKVCSCFLNIDFNNTFFCWEGDLEVVVVYTLGNHAYCSIADVVLEQYVVQKHEGRVAGAILLSLINSTKNDEVHVYTPTNDFVECLQQLIAVGFNL